MQRQMIEWKRTEREQRARAMSQARADFIADYGCLPSAVEDFAAIGRRAWMLYHYPMADFRRRLS